MRQLLVFGSKTFKLTIPEDARITFGPWSPPSPKNPYDERKATGTLRIYRGSEKSGNVLGVFSNVVGFRELGAIGYMEEVAKEEGATIWKDDHNGYVRQDKVERKKEWVEYRLPPATAPEPEVKNPKRKVKK